ncbi:MAG: hypothetical protein HY863_01795 [Chloroflexi bacterium]|nr:hypothetical protein [Chloroflexota bacterium]
MKKVFFLAIAFSLSLSACLPAILQPQATPTASPPPISVEDLQATATILAQESLQSLPSPILAPSETPVAVTATNTATQEVPTETQNPILLTLTATLGASIALPENGTATPTTTATLPINSTPTIGTPLPLHSGTMPPNLPYGKITLINRSRVEVYISLRCVTKDGYVTIIEYPVDGMIKTNAPAGRYTYVVWVGGRQILGDFALSKAQNLTIKIFKDRVEIK